MFIICYALTSVVGGYVRSVACRFSANAVSLSQLRSTGGRSVTGKKKGQLALYVLLLLVVMSCICI